jgi:hypothetical protein
MCETKITLNTLLNFIPQDENEEKLFNITKNVLSEYYDDTKRTIYNGYFYLGGQIKMTCDDEITIELINKVREITREKSSSYGEITNSWEFMSVNKSIRQLDEIENIIKNIYKIYEYRVVK